MHWKWLLTITATCRVPPTLQAPPKQPAVTIARPKKSRSDVCSLAAEKLLLDACEPDSRDAEIVRTDNIKRDLCLPYAEFKVKPRRQPPVESVLRLFVALLAGHHEVQASLHEKATNGRVKLKVRCTAIGCIAHHCCPQNHMWPHVVFAAVPPLCVLCALHMVCISLELRTAIPCMWQMLHCYATRWRKSFFTNMVCLMLLQRIERQFHSERINLLKTHDIEAFKKFSEEALSSRRSLNMSMLLANSNADAEKQCAYCIS